MKKLNRNYKNVLVSSGERKKGDSPFFKGYPRIVVSPPGPKARKIIELDQKWASPSYIKEYPFVMAGGQGAMAEDMDGNRYIDFMSGIAVSSTGYNHPEIVRAVQEAAGKFLHICGTDFYYEAMAQLQSAPKPTIFQCARLRIESRQKSGEFRFHRRFSATPLKILGAGKYIHPLPAPAP